MNTDNKFVTYLLFICLITGIGVIFALTIFLDKTNAQEVENVEPIVEIDIPVTINDLSYDLKPLVSSSKIVFTDNGYAYTPDMNTSKYDFLFSEIERYQSAYTKCVRSR